MQLGEHVTTGFGKSIFISLFLLEFFHELVSLFAMILMRTVHGLKVEVYFLFNYGKMYSCLFCK